MVIISFPGLPHLQFVIDWCRWPGNEATCGNIGHFLRATAKEDYFCDMQRGWDINYEDIPWVKIMDMIWTLEANSQ